MNISCYREILCVFQHAAVGQTGGGACDPAEGEGGTSSPIGKLLRPGQDLSAHSRRGVGCPTSTHCISWLLYERINDVLIEWCHYDVWTLTSWNSSLNERKICSDRSVFNLPTLQITTIQKSSWSRWLFDIHEWGNETNTPPLWMLCFSQMCHISKRPLKTVLVTDLISCFKYALIKQESMFNPWEKL